MFVHLSFFFWPLCCLFLDLHILITPLVSSDSSFDKEIQSNLSMWSPLLSDHLYLKAKFFLSFHRKLHMNWTFLRGHLSYKPLFLCPNGDLLKQVWLCINDYLLGDLMWTMGHITCYQVVTFTDSNMKYSLDCISSFTYSL